MQAFQLAPKLVVNITIDQLRSDYMEAFSPMYSAGGLRRIMHSGLVYEDAEYPYFPVDRASSIATISTGTVPYYNGIIASQWLDRETLQPISCVEDAKHGSSPMRLKTSTLSDELKINSNGIAVVYSFAADKESAILAAGHASNGAFWIEKDRLWHGTSFYSTLPDWLKTYNRQVAAKPDRKSAVNANDEVVDASLLAVQFSSMGKDETSDIIYITLSATKADKSPVTHWQTEMESVYVQLDNSLQRLIDGIAKQVALDQVLFVITSTGYSDEGTIDMDRFRIPTGTFYINRTANLLNMYLGAIYGQGRYVEQIYRNQLYLNHTLINQKRVSKSEVLSRCQEFLVQNAGIADVYTTDRLVDGNADIIKLRNGFNPVISGDVIIEVAPGWKLFNEDNHQSYTSRAGFVPFPIVFYGAGIKAERISTPVTVDRIAPTVAKAIRIRAPNACNSRPLF